MARGEWFEEPTETGTRRQGGAESKLECDLHLRKRGAYPRKKPGVKMPGRKGDRPKDRQERRKSFVGRQPKRVARGGSGGSARPTLMPKSSRYLARTPNFNIKGNRERSCRGKRRKSCSITGGKGTSDCRERLQHRASNHHNHKKAKKMPRRRLDGTASRAVVFTACKHAHSGHERVKLPLPADSGKAEIGRKGKKEDQYWRKKVMVQHHDRSTSNRFWEASLSLSL